MRPTMLFARKLSRLQMRRFGRLLSRFRRRQDGVAAVEFGFIASIMVLMLVGIIDISNAVSQNWRMAQLNRTLADLSSQVPSLTNAEVTAIFAASAATLSPYTGPMPTMVISSVWINNAGQARVCWSVSNVSGGALAAGSAVTLPNTAMATPNTSYIMSSTRMIYDGYISPNFTMDSKSLFFRPRTGTVGGASNIEQVQLQGQALCG